MLFQVLQDFIHRVIKTGFYHRSILPSLFLAAVDRSLQRSTSLECRSLGCLDLQFCTSSRVAANACSALAYFESAEANQCHVVAFFQGGGNDFNQCCDVAICIRFGAAGLACQCMSGSSDTSLCRRPLRTVHAPHNAYGSSRSKASCDTRFHNCIFQQTLMIPTAIEMVHFKIACRIRPAVSSFHNMTNIPWNAFCDRLLTG